MTRVKLRRIGGAKFEASNESGKTAIIDGPPPVGGNDEGVRPMELILMGLAGCSAMDVLHILKKQRQDIVGLDIDVDGTRADAIPAVYTDIHVHFSASGDVDPQKLERAVSLSMEKYCSVTRMLQATVKLTHSSEVLEAAKHG